MALTLTYTVTNLKVKDEVNADGVTLPNAVCQTYWKVTGTDGNGNTGEFSGATPFSAATVSEGNFVAFADLQEEDVISWITAVVDADPGYKAHIEEQCQRHIDESLTRDPEGGMPWAPDVTPDPEAVAAEGAAVDAADPDAPE